MVRVSVAYKKQQHQSRLIAPVTQSYLFPIERRQTGPVQQ